MSLGVLNNLSAVYAENNLNNSNNSLNTVLQQLSSGSKINSGADDAAGLSLVDGLQANQTALTQSVTNATEGVGLLQVADGALSQVTSLLNRAVTLATEASNGTLNSSQDTAANQEYQSILSEISNIGSTTTYNAEQVFGTKTDIYTGDSSVAGSSIDNLNIRSLSASNVGDSGGVMAYSSGQNNVFINLSGATNAQETDSLNASGQTSIVANYLVKGANGTETSAVATISVGGTSGYQNTAGGLISAINNAGLGLTASFTTAAQAGVAGGTTQTGIQIAGGLVSVGADPNSVSTSGVINPGGITNEDFNLGQTVTVMSGGATAASFVVGSSTNTLAGLAAAISNGTGGTLAAGSVTANVITNGDGSQSIALSDATGGGLLSVSATGGQGAQSLSNPTSADPTTPTSLNFQQYQTGAADGAGNPGAPATASLAFTSGYSATSNTVLSGTIVLSNGTGASPTTDTFVMGGQTGNGTIAGGTTLGSLAAAISTALGVTATVNSNGISLTSDTVGTTISLGSDSTPNLTVNPNVNVFNTVNGISATVGSAGSTTLSMLGGSGFGYVSGNPPTYGNNDTLTAGTSLVLSNGTADSPGTSTTFIVGNGTNGGASGNTITTANDTLNTLLTAIQTASVHNTTGISSATVNASGQIVLTSSAVGSTITMGSTTNLADQQAMSANSGTANAETVGGDATISIAGLTSAGTDILSGKVVIGNGMGGAADTFVMGSGVHTGLGTVYGVQGTGATANTYTVDGDTMTNLINAISDNANNNLGITASADGTVGLSLAMTSGTAYGSSISVSGSTLTDNYGTTLSAVTPENAGVGQFATITMNGAGNDLNTAGGILSGTLVVSSDIGGTNPVSDTFVMNNSGGLTGDTTGNTWDVNGGTVSALMTAINNAGGATNTNVSSNLDMTATLSGGGGIILKSDTTTDTTLAATTSALTENVAEVGVSGTQGQVTGGSATGYAAGTASTDGTITFGGSGTLDYAVGGVATNDALTSTGNMVIGNGISTVTFALGTTAGTSTSGGHTTVTTGGLNLNSLLTAINGSTLGITAAIDSLGTGIQLSTAADGTSISVTGANNISDNYGTQFTTPASGSTDQGAQYQGGLLTLDNGGKMSTDAGTLAGTLTLTSDTAANVGGYTATFVMGQATDSQINATTWGLKTADSNIAGLEAAINGTDESGANGVFVGAGAGVAAALDVTASTDTASGGIFVQSLNDNDSALSAVTTALTDNAAGAAAATTGGHNAGPADIVISNTGSSNLAGDTVTGDIVVSNTGTGSNENTTFTMGGTGGATGYGTQNVSVGGTTLNSLMTAIDNAGLSLSATISNGALSIASQDAGSTITAASALVDQYTINPATVNSGGNAPGQATQAVATLGTGVANGTDNLTSSNAVTGAVVITNNNVTDTFTMGTNAGSTNGYTFTTGSETLGGLAQAIDSASNLGLSATVANGVLNLQASATDTSITIGTDSLAATVSEGTNLSGTPGSATSGGSHSTATFTLGAGSLTTLSSNDVLVGSIAVTEAGVNGGNAVNFTMGATAAYAAANNTASQINVVGSTLSDLEGAMQSALGVDTQYANGSLVLSTPNNASIVITGTGSLQDFGAAPTQSSATLGTFASEGNSVSGMISFKDGNDGGALQTYSFTNQSITNLVNAINTTADIGVTASYAPSNGANPGGYGNLVLTSNTYGTDGNITDATLTSITDTTAAATVSYVGANAYNTGISNSNALGTALYDKSSGQSNPNGSGTSSFVANATGGSGIATISYSDGAGVSLQATDLSNQTDAEGSLNSLNSAITAVAAQDGYIGAQINTLNAVSQVLSTQQENVQAAQNAVQATDYASATSNMSKYEILSQTGIAALAQANSIQQEVTKLLQ